MKNYIPKYLMQKQNVIYLVLGTSLFAELFILIYKPFGSREWAPQDSIGDFIYLGFATLVVLVAMGVIACSRSAMYHYAKKHEISYISYAVWIFCEVLAMSLIYTMFATLFMTTNHTFFHLLQEALIYTAFILLIPYALFTLFFSLKDKNTQLQKAEQNKLQKKIINFCDEHNEQRISIYEDAIYYFQAADNYVIIYYLNSNSVRRYALRTSLKKLENELDNDLFVRVHRSYIVNLINIKVIEKTSNGLIVDFGQDGVQQLTVSKTYTAVLQDKMAQLNENINI